MFDIFNKSQETDERYKIKVKNQCSNYIQFIPHTGNGRSRAHCIVGDLFPRKKLRLILANIIAYLCILGIIHPEN